MDVKEVMDKLTLEEKARLLSGVGSWHTYDCNGKLPVIMMTDGPHGLRKQEQENLSDVNQSEVATCYPTASAMACSWNTEAIAKMADSIGQEALAEEVSIVLGCGTNIKRSPLCGRNFEYFSEDPYLAGTLATAYVKAMQELGVGTSLKHYAANNQEKRRMTENSQIDERAFREIYLTAFEKVVKEAQPTTIMASYNRLFGEYACANHYLLTDILRNEWGFQGAVVSDWGAAIDVVNCIKAGMDLEMPDSLGLHTQQIIDAVHNKEITMKELDRAVEQVVRLVLTLSENKKQVSIEYDKQHEIAKELCCESAVLLKNDGILPIAKTAEVLVIGELAEHMRFQGGGSSHITTRPAMNAINALEAAGVKVTYIQGYRNDNNLSDHDLELQAVIAAQKAAHENHPILFFGGLPDRFEGEGYDRSTLNIPDCQLELLEKLSAISKQIVFVSFSGAPIAMPFYGQVQSILQMYLGGQAVGEACAKLLVGEVNPSGKLAETFPCELSEVPSTPYFSLDTDDVEYRESIFVGYRYYETYHKPVQFEFGFGLSYTTFKYSDLTISSDTYQSGPLTVEFTIKNVGNCTGSEIAQVYVKNPACNYLRSAIELRGFTKVKLNAGESKRVSVILNERSFSLYDVLSHAFIVPTGEYEICIAASVRDIRLSQKIHVEGIPYEKDDRKLYPSFFNQGRNKSFIITSEEFEKLYGRQLSHLDDIKRGEFTRYHSLSSMAKKSFLVRIILSKAKNMLFDMNKDKPKDDPGVQMILNGLCDGPIDSVVCQSNGAFPENVAQAAIYAANGKTIKSIKSLLKK